MKYYCNINQGDSENFKIIISLKDFTLVEKFFVERKGLTEEKLLVIVQGMLPKTSYDLALIDKSRGNRREYRKERIFTK